MSILVDKNTRVARARASPARRAASTPSRCWSTARRWSPASRPGKGGHGLRGQVPIFDTVARGGAGDRRERDRSSSCPPPFAADAILEAADAGVALVVCITEGIPVLDMVRVKRYLEGTPDARLIGPNCPGVITPGRVQDRHHARLHPQARARRRRLAQRARSPTRRSGSSRSLGLGQSTCVGIGGDPVNGTDFVDVLAAVRGRPRDRRGHHDRRDRRHRRGGGAPRSSGDDMHEAGGRLHRRPDRAPREADGPRRRDHRRRQGHRGGEDRRHARGRDRRWWTARTCSARPCRTSWPAERTAPPGGGARAGPVRRRARTPASQSRQAA